MIAVVLSGGGNRGALEAGALLALFERGIKPEILVGTSAGALNATFIAINPSWDGAQQLADSWRKIKREQVFPGNALTALWRVISGADSLSPNDNLRRYIETTLPPGVKTFGDIKGVRLYMTTANINTAELFLFGDDPTALLVDAVLSSSAAPPLLPPITFNGWQFSDGASVANVPISIAVAKGATEIYAIDVSTGAVPKRDIHGIIDVALRAIGVMEHQQLLDDLEDVANNTNIKLHHLMIQSFPEVSDFDHANQFIDEGYRLMKDFLDGKRPTPPMIQVMGSPAPPGAVKWPIRKT